MIQTITLKQFRRFEHLEIRDLGRINLVVGTNNSGKSTVLEAIKLLKSPESLPALSSILDQRGEYVYQEVENRRRRLLEVCHLSHGHLLETDSPISIVAEAGKQRERLTIEVTAAETLEPRQLGFFEQLSRETGEQDCMALVLKWSGASQGVLALPVNAAGMFRVPLPGRSLSTRERTEFGVELVTTAALAPQRMTHLFDRIVLSSEEDNVVEALRAVEPRIERIAAVSTMNGIVNDRAGSRGGLVVKLKGMDTRVPIGSLGDGIWRMLGLALALARCSGGVLLVDAIDTGLHFSLMADMWKMIFETTKRLDVQVFATTHSRDCYESLATIARDSVSEGSEVTIQRIEPGRDVAVAFTEEEIVVAAERGIEVR